MTAGPRGSAARAPLLFLALLLAVHVPGGAATGDAGPSLAVPSAVADQQAADAEADEPLLPDAMNELIVVADPEADTALTLGTPNPVPPGDTDAAGDILSLAVAESGDAFRFSIKHRGYPDTDATLSEYVPLRQLDCSITFRLNGASDMLFETYLFGETMLDGGPWQFYAYGTAELDTGDRYEYEYLDAVPIALVGDHIEYVWPKSFISDNYQPLSLTDELTDFEIWCRKWQTLLVWFEDAADSSGGGTGSYPVQVAPQTNQIALSFEPPAVFEGELFGAPPLGPLSVPAGEQTRVAVHLQNLMERKLLVNLTADILDPLGQPLPGWKVQNAPTLEVRSQNQTQASLLITAPADAAHRAAGYVRVRATALGFDETATLSRRVFSVQSPDVHQNVLYFHHGPGFDWCFICIGGNNLGSAVIDPNPQNFMLNVLETDPAYTNEATEGGAVALFNSPWHFAQMDAPSARPMRFDPEGTIDVQVALRSDVARDIEFEAYLQSEEETLAVGRSTLAVTENFQDFVLRLPVSEDAIDLPAGRTLYLQMHTEETVALFGSGIWISPLEWDPAQSRITLPLVPLPTPVLGITDGRALPTITFAAGTESEEYINPEGQSAFDLVLVNEGLEEDVLTLSAEVSHPGWSIRFDPGQTFSLAPGAGAPLCVAARAPANAQEGDVVHVNLTATSRLDAAVRTSVPLRLTVTDGIEIPDRLCGAIAPEDAVPPLDDERKGSPAPPLTLVVAFIGALALAARRRGRDVC